MKKIINTIGITLAAMLATGAATILGLVLPYGICESLFRFGVNYGITQVLYWILMPVIIVGAMYLIWTIIRDMIHKNEKEDLA